MVLYHLKSLVAKGKPPKDMVDVNISTDYDKLETIVELKHSAADASDAELQAKAEEGIAKLHQYASDPSVPDLAKDTAIHLILFQFKGFDLCRLEEIPILH